MGVNDTGAYDVQRLTHNIPPKQQIVLPNVIGTTAMSEEDGGCSYLGYNHAKGNADGVDGFSY